eukprot:TRINITY_DN2049_c0_g5_i1.p2 TRINITY_DN2049_c0_g5~~TRINITY_DN2049_c0_g5_i1.p2  ORF type:complete len:114 (-),score=18.25 TRINITY_DN2049_c0_g5_i1:347-688(-)
MMLMQLFHGTTSLSRPVLRSMNSAAFPRAELPNLALPMQGTKSGLSALPSSGSPHSCSMQDDEQVATNILQYLAANFPCVEVFSSKRSEGLQNRSVQVRYGDLSSAMLETRTN